MTRDVHIVPICIISVIVH